MSLKHTTQTIKSKMIEHFFYNELIFRRSNQLLIETLSAHSLSLLSWFFVIYNVFLFYKCLVPVNFTSTKSQKKNVAIQKEQRQHQQQQKTNLHIAYKNIRQTYIGNMSCFCRLGWCEGIWQNCKSTLNTDGSTYHCPHTYLIGTMLEYLSFRLGVWVVLVWQRMF